MFDLDGTLIEFKFKVKESREALISHLQGLGFDVSRLSTELKTQAIIEQVKVQLEKSPELGLAYTFDEVKSQLSTLLDKFELNAFKETKVHPGSLSVLKTISSRKILTAVITNSGRHPVDLMLESFGFMPYLSLIVTRNEMTKLKPEPDGLLRALDRLGVRASDSLYVGDSVIDIQASKKAGVKSVAVTTGLYQAEALQLEEPDYLISRIEELEKIVFPG